MLCLRWRGAGGSVVGGSVNSFYVGVERGSCPASTPTADPQALHSPRPNSSSSRQNGTEALAEPPRSGRSSPARESDSPTRRSTSTCVRRAGRSRTHGSRNLDGGAGMSGNIPDRSCTPTTIERAKLTRTASCGWTSASRMILAGGEFSAATSDHAIETLGEALMVAKRWNLTVREVNTDRGAQFYANPRQGSDPGLGRFQEFLERQGIRHVVSRVNNPQTNGKAERLWLEYDKLRWRFATLAEWIEWKNDEVHGALWALETPREAFQRKLPPESLLGLHMRAIDQIPEAA